MLSYNTIITFAACAFLATGYIQAQDAPAPTSNSFTIEGSYIGDLVSDLGGGIRRGTNYLGLANLKAGYKSDNSGWWKGGEFSINAANTHGGTPSANLVGDFQGVSNIEAGNLTFLYELWYKQTIRNLSFTFGLQDLNSNFAATESGSLFTNSSFGIHSSIADNIPSPLYPLTALGATFQWNPNDKITWLAAIFDGTPDDFENNPYNTDWKLCRNDGYLTVIEIQFPENLIRSNPGSYKIGAYFHQHNDSISKEQTNYGIYFVGDQLVYKTVYGGLSLFSQVGISPKHRNRNNHYFSLGLNLKGISRKRSNDQAGIAVAYAGFCQSPSRDETAVELTYQVYVNENIRFKPDLQYIIHPSGTDAVLKNALVGMVRLQLYF